MKTPNIPIVPHPPPLEEDVLFIAANLGVMKERAAPDILVDRPQNSLSSVAAGDSSAQSSPKRKNQNSLKLNASSSVNQQVGEQRLYRLSDSSVNPYRDVVTLKVQRMLTCLPSGLFSGVLARSLFLCALAAG